MGSSTADNMSYELLTLLPISIYILRQVPIHTKLNLGPFSDASRVSHALCRDAVFDLGKVTATSIAFMHSGQGRKEAAASHLLFSPDPSLPLFT